MTKITVDIRSLSTKNFYVEQVSVPDGNVRMSPVRVSRIVRTTVLERMRNTKTLLVATSFQPKTPAPMAMERFAHIGMKNA